MCKTHGSTPDRDKNKDGRIMTVLRLVRVEHHTVSLAAFVYAALRLLPVGVSLTGNLMLRCLKNSSAETLRP